MSETQPYEVAAQTFEELLAPGSVAFEIPELQRRYAWRRDEVEVMLEDLYANLDQAKPATYFLGSLVLARPQIGGGPAVVLDGQQRLTTLSLLLAVIKHKLHEYAYTDTVQIQTCLETGRLGERKKPKIKLQPEDQELYEILIRNPVEYSTREHSDKSLAQSVKHILAFVGERAGTSTELLKKMATRILYGVEFIRITVNSEADAFRLFESLNDRGLDLNAADLIKTKLLSLCDENNRDEVRQVWSDILELFEPLRQGEIVNFLRYFWIAFHGPVRGDGLYAAVREHLEKSAKSKPDEALKFAKDLGKAAEDYLHIAEPTPKTSPWGEDVAEDLQRLVDLRARSCRPVLLACASSKNHSELMSIVVRACEAITIRYSVIGGRNPNQLERLYDEVCRQVRAGGDPLAALHKTFAQIIPSNDDFEKGFRTAQPDSATSARTMLIRLNEQVSQGETGVLGAKRVHLEHILPQSPSLAALSEAELSVTEASDLSGSIGNLTLLAGRRNQSISNSGFSKKRPAFEKSDIALNREIAKAPKWRKVEIEQRALRLAKLALLAWPWPVDATLRR